MAPASKITIISMVCLMILVIAIGAVLLIYQGKPVPLLKKIVTVPLVELSSGEVIKVMQKQMMLLKTAHYEINSNFQSLSKEVPVGVQTRVVFDGGWQNKITGRLLINNEISLQGFSYLANIEIRATQEKSYFRIKEIPAIPFVDLAIIQNKWYAHTAQTSEDEYSQTFFKIQTLVFNNDFFTVTKRLSDEIIDGLKMYHYTVKVSKEMAQKLIDFLPANILSGQNNTFDQLENAPWEMWIGKKDKRLYKLIGELENENNQMSFEIEVSQFNKVVTIEEPSESYSMTEFSQDLFGNTNFLELPLFGYSVGIDTQELIEDTDKDGLYTIWENVFKTDSDNPDTDEDGYLDGEEIRNGYNPKGKGRLFSIE